MIVTTPSALPTAWYQRLELPSVLPGAILAAVMLWSVAQSLIDANWAEGMGILVVLVLPALVVGIVFARLAWLPGWLAHLLATALGVAWVVQRVGPTLVAQVRSNYGAAMATRLGTWTEQASEILLRVLAWLRVLQAGGRGEDVLLFLVTVALLMWGLGYTTGWLIFRSRRAWMAVIPSAIIILLNYTFAFPKPNQLFFTFLSSALILLVYQNITSQQQTWRAAKIEFPELMLWRIIASAALFCIVLVSLTGLLPGTVTNTEAQRAWRILRSPFVSLRESWQDAFSTINAPPGTAGGFATRGVRVGGPRALGDTEVMRVRSTKYDYWRAVAFDRYSGHNWQNTVGERARATLGLATAEQARSLIAPGEPLIQAELRARQIITQTVTLTQPRTDGLLMIGGQFASAGVPVLIQHGILTNQDGKNGPNFTETSSVVADVTLDQTSTYTVSTYISTVDEQSLRQAGTSYPDWVRSSYLQLPDTLPARVRDRARELATTAQNPYDQALSIQGFLRTLSYDERRPAPPEERDWVDYFIFDSQRGYCDDFATAMVVMLRSVGVPARWVQGYAGGTLDPNTREWIVRESVAHSWVEAYFPGYGWQRFEPTPAPYAIVPNRPALPAADETDTSLSSGDVSNQLSDPEEILRRIRKREEDLNGGGDGDPAAIQRAIAERIAAERQRALTLLGTIMATLCAGVVGADIALKRQLRGLSASAATYARLTRLGGWAGVAQEEHTTPREYAETIIQHIPEQRDQITQIAAAYESERYRPDHPTNPDTSSAWPPIRRALIGRLFARALSMLNRTEPRQ